MSISWKTALRAVVAGSLALACAWNASLARAQAPAAQPPQIGLAPAVKFQVKGAAERLEMTVNTSRVVEFPADVPKMLVNNPDLVRVVPISPRSIQLSAVKAGVTQLNVWDDAGNVTAIDLIVLGDVADLDQTLKSLFPEASLRLRPLNSSLYISGYVPKAEMVQSITNVARDYFPNIINDMSVGGVQKVLLHVKVLEVSRTKLRTLGVDWAQLSGGSFVSSATSQILQTPGTLIGNSGANVRFGIVDTGSFYGFVEALREYNLAKLMAEPTLTTLSGRPASFNVGGQVPIPLQQALGVTTVQYREFGTRIDFVPIVLGNGVVRLEVRPEITEIDPSLRDSVTGVPGFRSRTADTAVEMKAGQTLAIAGLVYSREDAVNRGIPWIADVPWFGVPFRRVSNKRNEVELLIFVTPEFCEALDPNEVPPCGPGQNSVSPSDVELYYRGYMEVPKPCNGPNCAPGMGHGMPGYGPGMIGGGGYEELPPIKQPEAQPMAASQRRTIGTGVSTPAAMPILRTLPPQNRNSTQDMSSAGQNPTPALRPALIGPQGYDDLR
ncbi:MAG: pilus assembly protein N-terminal domain-containing protein [Pirellulaceae bacterium]|nr:pilus assembly protein N-terminal domain-containing protein [Pirellulaceae bacterium]